MKKLLLLAFTGVLLSCGNDCEERRLSIENKWDKMIYDALERGDTQTVSELRRDKQRELNNLLEDCD